ncbi:hypothetical protein [Lewinella sp. JB7]|uniref:hypothetical protein n=1 Tax=Lewinella sp. JB7 TaxID=2962887 RepID=UPI0020C9667D|nr:hypothetical protein [Lewinella sp. JB7]MCP9235403.1 hypothetical protein [Lewinella sp. JB7]
MDYLATQLTLATRYGDATFTLRIAADGSVELTGLPLEGLPESVYKLTYGQQWTAVRQHFRALGRILPDRLSANLGNERPPTDLAAAVTAFNERFPQPRELTAFARFWAGHPKQASLFSTESGRVTAALDAFRQRGQQRNVSHFGPFLQDYLKKLLPLADHRTTVLIYAAIGALQTEEARNFLLQQLESEGRHPFSTKILRALTFARDPDTFHRLAAVYRSGKFGAEEVLQHLQFLGRFGREIALDHVMELLADYPAEAEAVGRTLGDLGLAEDEIADLLIGEFKRQSAYPALDPLLRAINRRQVPGHGIGLREMNEKVDHPRYLDLPPVNWPQQLEEGWKELVAATELSEAYAVVGSYIERSEPRLQRNALLQLKVLRARDGAGTVLPLPIERRLRELVSSRYDKVYVEVLNILGGSPFVLAERKKMLLAILNVSIGSRYRFVVLNALRTVGDADALRQFSRAYYGREIATAPPQSDRLQQMAGLLPYLDKYLGDTQELQQALSQRRSNRN